MIGVRTDRWTSRTGVLLLAAHVMVLSLAPSAHLGVVGADVTGVAVHAHPPGTPDHTEGPRRQGTGHDHAACHICQLVDGRFTGAPIETVDTGTVVRPTFSPVQAWTWHGRSVLPSSHGPRAPPHA